MTGDVAGGLPAEFRDAAAGIFGERLETAERYAVRLATVGADRGLIGPREIERVWVRHVLNCAVLGEAVPASARVFDVGSGAGLPGIPLALARPDVQVVLVEPLLRRATFLSETVGELGLSERVEVVRGRAEEPAVRKGLGGADVVTSRAVAPLGKLVRWCLPLTSPDGSVIAMKGESAADELVRDRSELGRVGGVDPRVIVVGDGTAYRATLVVLSRKPGRRAR